MVSGEAGAKRCCVAADCFAERGRWVVEHMEGETDAASAAPHGPCPPLLPAWPFVFAIPFEPRPFDRRPVGYLP